jgi:uncharacterized protein
MAWRGLVAVVVVVVGVGGLVVAGMWAFQRRLVYFPDRTPAPPAAAVLPGGRDVTLHTTDGLDLKAWFVPPPARDRGLAVLVAPGNAGNRAGRAGVATALRDRGFAVLLMDYRGYGGNPGSPSEEGLSRDADAAVRTLTGLGYPPERTLYLGESLGTGVVAGLQERHPPAGVVLRSPFTELAAVGAHHYPWLPVRRLLRDRFPVAEPMSRSDVPTVVVYGDRDSVVPSSLSAEVARRTRTLVATVVLPADHNDPVMFGPRLADAVARLADTLPPRS